MTRKAKEHAMNILLRIGIMQVEEKDGSNLMEYKVFSLSRIYEVLVNDTSLPYHLFYIFFCEYLLEKHQLLRKVKEFRVKGIILIIFS